MRQNTTGMGPGLEEGMDNDELIDRARERPDTYLPVLAERLRNAESQLAKYRAAPTVGYLQGHAFYGAHQTRPVAYEVQLIARPEAR